MQTLIQVDTSPTNLFNGLQLKYDTQPGLSTQLINPFTFIFGLDIILGWITRARTLPNSTQRKKRDKTLTC